MNSPQELLEIAGKKGVIGKLHKSQALALKKNSGR